nr:unnamed protein product [Spirometra erinaceieuropaei]
MAAEMASLKLQLARLTSSRSRSRRRSRSRPRNADTCWYHTNFGEKTRRCSPPFSFKLKQGNRSAREKTRPLFLALPALVAPSMYPWSSPPSCQLFPHSHFGSLSLTLNISLCRSFTWIFVIADVPHAIFGSDFLSEFDLLVDCRRARLLDRITGLSVRGLTPFTAPTNVSALDTNISSFFRELLLRHPNISKPQFRSGEVQHDFVHHLRTSGPPVFVRPRKLAPERFQTAKAEFEHMLQLGIIRPSESPWASSMHMVPKATSCDWGPCGDYRALKSATIPVSHLQDFARALFGKAVLSKIDLLRAFHQIPVAPKNIPKTAFTTPFGPLEFMRMPFGLRNAAQTFQRFIDHVLRSLSFVYAYTDDHLAASRNEHHVLVFDRLDMFGVVINPSKLRLHCFHGPQTVDFALRSHSDKYNPKEIAHLDCISQFTTEIRHIDGSKNEVADMLSRPSLSFHQLSHGIDLCAMAAEQQRVGCPGDESVSGLQLKDVPLTTGSGTILCDVSTLFYRPFAPASMRRAVFQTLHGFSHPGIRASQKLLAGRFVWTGMDKEVKAWARSCLNCQRNKVQRHNKSPLGTFHSPDTRFSYVYLDVVGSLPPSNGFTQLLTCVDRGTRIRTTAYHPAANGMAERFHRQLKTTLRAVESPGNWLDNLRLTLLGIRAALKSDLDCGAAVLVFGTTLRLPGEMAPPDLSRGRRDS